MDIFWLIFFGVLGGILGGMGMGGGTVLIPLLTIFLGISQKLAQGYNLISFLIMAVFAIIIHLKNKMIDFKSIIVLCVSGLLFCILGAYLTTLVDSNILQYIFAGFLVLLSIFEFYKAIKEKTSKN